MRFRSLLGLLILVLALPEVANAEPGYRQFHFRNTSQSPDSDQPPMFGSLVSIDPDQVDIFQWRPAAAAVLHDYEQTIEERAQRAINNGEWARVIGEFRNTKAATNALDRLQQAGMGVRTDGRVVPLSQMPMMISIVAFTR